MKRDPRFVGMHSAGVHVRKIRVMHLITSLNMGGAETALARLANQLDRDRFELSIVTLMPVGVVGEQARAAGHSVASLEMPAGRATVRGLVDLIRQMKEFKPDVLQTWMYHADLLGLIAGSLTGVPAIAWNIRGSELDFSQYRRLSRIVVKACAVLSGLPQVVVVNSRVGQANHSSVGYRPRRWEYIPNGVDLAAFAPDPASGAKIRAEWGVTERETLIGTVGRLDPQKDHPSFLQAAALVARSKPNVRFVCVGSGPPDYLAQMKRLTESLGLSKQVIWAGLRTDTPAIYNALDLFVLASAYGEGFPNVVAEAMACCVPCVVTDIGDAAMLVGDTGLVVPHRDPAALASAMLRISSGKSSRARARIVGDFSLETMAGRYTALYASLSTPE